MKINPRNIAEGWWNLWLSKRGTLDSETQQLADARLAICLQCPVRDGNTCSSRIKAWAKDRTVFSGCNCPVTAKCMSPNESCPGGYW